MEVPGSRLNWEHYLAHRRSRLLLSVDRYPKQNDDAEPDHHDKDPTGRDIQGKRLAMQARTGTAPSAKAGASDHRSALPQRTSKI